ncbi:cytochrome P450 [Hyalangium sp.]|uniref:cytochrome P450 n=1 Tax=Hyalangium sp. TaxID=2028555 RepID=UPI002D436882|nr:cytochrome P450 [Hyalangium sp.]HYI01874.1 cytochrome P450 [Hyalangium sp.]
MSPRLNLLAPEVRANPYPHYAELRRTAPVCQVDPGGLWAVSRYDDVIAVLKNPQLFSSEGMRRATCPPWFEEAPFAQSMIVQDPPEHGRLRVLVNRAFGPAALSRLEPWVRQRCQTLVEQLPAEQPLDLIDAFTRPLPASVIGELLGLEASLQPLFKRWADDLTSVSSVAPGDTARKEEIRSTAREARQHLTEALAQRRRSPGEDMLSDLLATRVEGEALTEPELMSFLFLLLIAGMETTIHLLNHSVRLLMEYPEVLARVRANPSLLPKLVEEVLRYEPPVHAIMRVTTAETELSGVRLPQGAWVMAMLASASRDETRFPHSERFELERPGPQNLPFGHGVHFCLGAPLARLEARLGLEALLSRFSGFAPRGPVTWNHSLSVRGPRVLPVELFPSTSTYR